MVNFIWFGTDKKLWTVLNYKKAQLDRVYVPADTRKEVVLASHLLRARSNFWQSAMVSIWVSTLEWMAIHSVDSGV